MFDRLKEIRRKASRLEQHMAVLLQGAQQDAAMGTRARAPGAGVPPAAPAPPPVAAPKNKYPPPRPMGTTADYNDHHGFQNPASPSAPKLPPPAGPSAQEAAAALSLVLGHIEDLRATAFHLHNAAKLLIAISDVIEAVIMQQVRRPPPR